MASSIDPTKPVRGTPTTRSVRDNFKAAKEEIEALQAGTSITDLDLGTTTVTGTTAQFNAALSDDDFATLTNNVTLQNKNIDLDSNTLTGTKAEFNTAVQSDTFVFYSDFNANTLLAADTNNTPTARTISEQEVVGRLTGGNITGISIGIADDNMVQVDGSPNDDEYARWTANGLEGRTEAEFKADFNLEIGTDVQAHSDDLDSISGGIDALTEEADPDDADHFLMQRDSDGGYRRVTGANLPGSGGDVGEVATLSDLKALSANEFDVVISQGYSSAGDGGGGTFRWDGSDLSTEVSADTQNGIHVPPNSDATGASGAWVRQYNGPLFVEWFGAAGDGSTDDVTAIQAAIDQASGKTIRLLGKTYRISEALTWTDDEITIEGEGRVTLIETTSTTDDVFRIGDGTNEVRAPVFRKLSINASSTQSSGYGIRMRKCVRQALDEVYISPPGASNNIFNGVSFELFDNAHVERCYIKAVNDGVLMHGESDQTYGANIQIGGTTRIVNCGNDGINIGGSCGGVLLSEVDVIGSGRYNVRINKDSSTANNREIFFGTGCYIDTADSHGLNIEDDSVVYLDLTGAWFSANGQGGSGNNIQVDGAQNGNFQLKIVGCRIVNAADEGITINDGSFIIDGCDISDNGSGAGATREGSGIRLTNNNPSQFIISNNRIANNGNSSGPYGFGITIPGVSTDNFIVVGNVVQGNEEGQIQNGSGTSATQVVANNIT